MTFRDAQAPLPQIWPAITAGLFLFVAAALSILSVQIGANSYGAAFIPLLVLLMWPRRANGVMSIGLVFLAGVFTDWATGGVVGQWALVFCLVWGFLRPGMRSSGFTPLNTFLIWMAICGLAFVTLVLTGRIVYGIWPDYGVIGRQILLATALLPFVYLLRLWLVRWRRDVEDWDI